jgi:serine phosphatase RsbU (regulator of sigma subunit)/tetratricopeptide (TPR) repeat protein
MLRLSLFYFLLLCSFVLSAQNKKIDSLETLLKQTGDERKQIPILNSLAFEYKGIDPYKTRSYGDHAYLLASRYNDAHGQSDALQRKGLSYYYLDSYDTALIYYHQSLLMAKSTGDSSLFAQAYSSIGNVYRLQGVNDTALKYLQQALRIYQNIHDEKNVAACLSTIGDTYLFATEFDKALQYHQQALEMARKQKDNYREAFCLSSIANNYHMRGDFQNSIKYHEQVISIAEPIGEMNIVAGSLGTIADAYANLYNYPKAIETYLRALDIAEKKDDKHNTAYIYAGMSDIYQRQKDYVNAVKYLNMSISLSMQIGDYNRTCYGMLTMAEINIDRKDTASARKLIDRALATARQYNYPNNEATALRLKGSINFDEGHFVVSEELMRASLKLWENIGDDQQIAETKTGLAKTLSALGKTDEAILEGEKAYVLAVKISTPEVAMKSAEVLVGAFEKKGGAKKALFYSKRLKMLSDSLNSAENTKKQTELFLQYQFDKEKEKANIVQEQKDAIAAAETRKQNIIIWSGAGILLLVIGFALFVYRSYRQKQKANDIITEQKKIVEEKNREITDSINYARNIQVAMLPTENAINEFFPENFVVFRPRDIVSGDFYWIGERDDLNFFAVADCTGHGVPGGFMSMLGITLLNEILAEKAITSPAAMLNELRVMVVQSLNRARKPGEMLARDGMDISICCIDRKNKKLIYSGANNSVYLFRNNERIELRPDKQPVGAHESEKPFTEQTHKLTEGDVIIAYSDGYPDQFGGEHGKKMMYKRFKELLDAAAKLPMKEAGKMLELEFENWKIEYAQVDDVCIFGIRLNKI